MTFGENSDISRYTSHGMVPGRPPRYFIPKALVVPSVYVCHNWKLILSLSDSIFAGLSVSLSFFLRLSIFLSQSFYCPSFFYYVRSSVFLLFIIDSSQFRISKDSVALLYSFTYLLCYFLRTTHILKSNNFSRAALFNSPWMLVMHLSRRNLRVGIRIRARLQGKPMHMLRRTLNIGS